MADTQHTPTPWSIGGLSSNPGEGHVIESDSADRTIAWTANSYCASNDEEYISQEDEANADFIIQACNSHDALVEVLETLMALEDGEPGSYDDPDTQERADEIWKYARNAIDKAKGVRK